MARKGAEHRNIGINYLYYSGALHLTSFYQFLSTNILRLYRFLMAKIRQLTNIT
jgi:hypothetical protein